MNNNTRVTSPSQLFEWIFFFFILFFHNNTGFITILTLFLIFIFVKNRNMLRIDTLSQCLLLFGIYYLFDALIKGRVEDFSLVILSLCPFCFYLYGKVLGLKLIKMNEKRRMVVMLLLALSYSALMFLSVLQNIIQTGSIINPVRLLTLYGDSSIAIPATQVGTNIAIAFGCLPIFFICKESWLLRIGYLFAFSLAIISTFNMVNRAGLVVSVICLVLTLFLYYRQKKGYHILILFSFVLFISIVYNHFNNSSDVGEVVEAYEEREMDDTATMGAGGGRTVRWMDAIATIPKSPFGWEGGKYTYAHNMWLDIAKSSGWIPFLLLLITSFKAIKDLITHTKKNKSSFVMCLFAYCTSMLLCAFVEPVDVGFFLAILSLLWGIQRQLLKLV